MAVKKIPQGFRTVTPHLICRDANKAIEFYERAFGAEQVRVHKMPNGGVMHAELKIGDSIVMLGEEMPDYQALSPQSLGNTPVVIHLFTENVDSLFDRAVKAGATATMPVMDQFWGDRYGQLKDPFGHRWSIATHVEDVPESEMAERAQKAMEQMTAKKR
jgi:PhnB protein